MRKKKLFKNPDVLYEATSYCSLTSVEKKERKAIRDRVNRDIKDCKTEIVAFIAPNGSGKSTTLKSVLEGMEKDGKISYASFEAWQYQDEHKIWEDFLISVSAEDSRESKDEYAKKFERSKIKKKFWVFIITLMFSYIFLSFLEFPCYVGSYSFKVNPGELFLGVLTIFGVAKIISDYYYIPKVSHIYQYEDELLKILLDKNEKPIVMLVEDVDRTDSGRKLMKILHTFINGNRNKIHRSFVVICPIPREAYYGAKDEGRKERLKRIEESNKIFDYTIWSGLHGRTVEDDVATILLSAGCSDTRVGEFFRIMLEIVDKDESLINLRAFKSILREAEQFLNFYPTLDPCVAILFIMTKYVMVKDADIGKSEKGIYNFLINRDGNFMTFGKDKSFASLIVLSFGLQKDVDEILSVARMPTARRKIKFEFTRDAEPHVISVEGRKGGSEVIDVRLSGHYKELL